MHSTEARATNTSSRKIEAGLSLQGWEVKSLRAGKANISEAYVIFRDGEAYLFGSSFLPLQAASSHVVCDPTRTRKLLLSRRELDKLESLIARQGYTVVPSLSTGNSAGSRSRSAW